MRNVLILYRYFQNPPRVTIEEHLYSLARYSKFNCFYHNIEFGPLPKDLWNIKFDLIVFHTTFLSWRWAREHFIKMTEDARWLREIDAVKVAMPQDEFISTDLLCNFINQIGVDVVFSVAPESEWPKIYETIDRSRVKLFRILTGYLDDRALRMINRVVRRTKERPIDIGYRSKGLYWLGRHGYMKSEIAHVFQAAAPEFGLTTDLSTDWRSTILGDEWYVFLCKCKYTIGIEGGGSILDRDGQIRLRTDKYMEEHPQASFDEVEAACFPGLDGTLRLYAASPRHLEACATRTCQVLIEGEYNGILTPGVHYIEVKRDYSNLNEVLDVMKRDELREAMTARAYDDIVASRRYSYQQFVKFFYERALAGAVRPPLPISQRIWGKLAAWRLRFKDRLLWKLWPYKRPYEAQKREIRQKYEQIVKEMSKSSLRNLKAAKNFLQVVGSQILSPSRLVKALPGWSLNKLKKLRSAILRALSRLWRLFRSIFLAFFRNIVYAVVKRAKRIAAYARRGLEILAKGGVKGLLAHIQNRNEEK